MATGLKRFKNNYITILEMANDVYNSTLRDIHYLNNLGKELRCYINMLESLEYNIYSEPFKITEPIAKLCEIGFNDYSRFCDTINKEEYNMNNNVNVEDLILSGTGIRGMKNIAMSKIINYYYNKVKNHFGFEMYFNSVVDVDAATALIKSIDKDFVNHSRMVNSQKERKINSTFILKLRNDTYLLVNGNVSDYKNNDSDFVQCSLYLYFFGKKSYQEMNRFKSALDESKDCVGNTIVYGITGMEHGDDWSCIGRAIKSREFSTLYFDNDIEKDIKEFIDTWLDNEETYINRGLLFKTGILLHGSPGTGKSSIATAIADYLKCDLVNIDMSTFNNINITSLVNTINSDNNRYVVLLDEIDAVFKNREEDLSETQNNKVTKLLTFLDSVQSPNNVIFVATTNYYDRLDPALLRKGRFDKEYQIDGISKETARRMCKGFNLSDKSTSKLLSNKPDDKLIIPSTLQAEILEQIKYENCNKGEY